MTARAESSPSHLSPASPFSTEITKKEILDERFDVRYHTLVKSYSFLTKNDGWYRIDFPYFEETLHKEVILYNYDELSRKLAESQDTTFEPTTEGENHYHTQKALIGLCDFIHPKLVPLQGSPIVHASAYKEVDFGDNEQFSQADIIYILPDMSIVIIEVGRNNGRKQQVENQVKGLEKMVGGQKLTVYAFFCHYEFGVHSSTPNNNSGKEKRLTFRPILLDSDIH